jgi:hypothetical protein
MMSNLNLGSPLQRSYNINTTSTCKLHLKKVGNYRTIIEHLDTESKNKKIKKSVNETKCPSQ